MPTRKPDWLRVPYNPAAVSEVSALVSDLKLNTVCTEANCPNIGECYEKRTATFMVMGSVCTRNCAFCNVQAAKPAPLDPDEPEHVAEAAKALALVHVVITQVTRDDLPDGGAAHMAATVAAVKAALPKATVEVLVSDMKGNRDAIDTVLASEPDVFGHNIEMVKSLHPTLRAQADYEQSLGVLAYAKEKRPLGLTKTGFMVGLGETDEEIEELLADLVRQKVDILTIGQYLQPSQKHATLRRYVTPDEFDRYAKMAKSAGIPFVVSTPLVRSSYRAAEALEKLKRAD